MKNDHLVYWLVYDGYLKDYFINVRNVEIDPIFNQTLLSYGRGKLFNIWPENVRAYIIGERPVNFLMCTGHIKAVSDNVKNIIEKIAKGAAEFLPIQFYYEDGRPYTKMTYWVCNTLAIVDALDWDKTVWTETTPPNREDPDALLMVIKPRMYANKVANNHFFRILISNWVSPKVYVSRELKRAFEFEKCTVGIEFTPIITT